MTDQDKILKVKVVNLPLKKGYHALILKGTLCIWMRRDIKSISDELGMRRA